MTRIQVLDKTARILDEVAAHDGITVVELAAATGEPRGTIYRILANLERLGYVEPAAARGRYRLGLKLFHLGASVSARFADERLASLPVMERIHEVTGQTTFLSVRRGYRSLCVERIDGLHVKDMLLRVGVSMPLHVRPGGHVLLAFEVREFWKEYTDNVSLTERTVFTTLERSPRTARALVADLERVRKAGYSVNHDEVILGISALAAPIFDFEEKLRGTLVISGATPSILGEEVDRIRGLVLEGACRISETLGFDMAASEYRSEAAAAFADVVRSTPAPPLVLHGG